MKPYFEAGGISLFHADARDAIDLVVVNGTVEATGRVRIVRMDGRERIYALPDEARS